MTQRKWTIIIFSGIVLLLLLIGAMVVYVEKSPSPGNYWINLYGRIVNEKGVGIEGVAVEFQYSYFDQAPAPMPFPQNDKIGTVTVLTDQLGNFHVGPVQGFNIDPKRFSKNGKDLVLAMSGPVPDLGGSMGERTSRMKMPDTPAKRMTYVLKDPLQ